ncbi:MAG: hypothetical protein ACJAVO_001610 [Parvibaculaceae bacterium]|jgi:hypothetical protein|nr:DUF3035 domain-containing protein [Parvibaculaceae bacterium]|tara:strand:- start:232 stop:810 length:579 start_codon:yes stop_codon:yes gene_type:complete
MVFSFEQMRRKALVITGATVLALSLSGCGGGDGIREALGYTKEAPDEFTIVTKAPLVVPPDFSLRPPRPGAPSPRETQPEALAESLLIGTQSGTTAADKGEQILLAKAGATRADSDIRTVIDEETRSLKAKQDTFTNDVLFWKKQPDPAIRTVDAAGEAKRLRENEALGLPVTEGVTPEEEEDEGGIFDYLF